MRRHVGVRIAVVILGTIVCAWATWASLVIMIFAPFATDASGRGSDVPGFALLGSLIAWLGTLIAYRFPRTAAILISIGTLVFSPIAISYNEENVLFVPSLIFLIVGAIFGVREREKQLESRNVRT